MDLLIVIILGVIALGVGLGFLPAILEGPAVEKTKTYEFRVNCLLSGDFETTVTPFSLPLPATLQPVTAFLPARNNLGEKWMTLTRGGFTSESEAREAGIPVKRAALLAGLQIGCGIDVGTDDVLSPAAGSEPDDRFQPFVHGLQVAPEIEGRMMFGFLYVGRAEPKNFRARFEKAFADGYAPERSLNPKQTTAAALYGHSHFHSSDATRVLTLVSAIEALARTERRSSAAVEHLTRMIEAIEGTDLAPSEKQDLVNGLRNLKQESIGSACRALVGRYCTDPDVERFPFLYKVRSRLSHSGESPKDDLAAIVRELDPIVRRVVVGDIVAAWRESSPSEDRSDVAERRA